MKESRKCQDNQSCPPVAPLHPWIWPTFPWTRLHIDYCGPVAGKLCLVVVDAHTKWIEAFPASSATSYITMEKLWFLFSQLVFQNLLYQIMLPIFVVMSLNSFYTKMELTPNFFPLPSCLQWLSREGCSDTEEWIEEITRRIIGVTHC